MEAETYNGWANYETWNVALWISNDEGLYSLAKECKTYARIVNDLIEEFGAMETPDHVSYSDSGLDTDALDKMISEL